MSNDYGCRISRVKMKSGGAEVRIPRINRFTDMGRALMDDAAKTADYPFIEGYALFSWDRDLNCSVVYKWEDVTLQPSSLPSFLSDRLSDVMRREGHKD